jgi:hypothetical protein
VVQTVVLEELGIKLDSASIRERLAKSKQETVTLRRLLKIAEEAERFKTTQKRQEVRNAS